MVAVRVRAATVVLSFLYHVMKTILFLAFAVIAQAAGNVCLTLGMHQLKAAGLGTAHWREIAPDLAILALTNPWLWAGAALLILFTVLFTLVLSWTDLSLALPVISVEIVVNVALAGWLLGEVVGARHWLGTLMVAAGVALVIGTANDRAPAATSSAPTEGQPKGQSA